MKRSTHALFEGNTTTWVGSVTKETWVRSQGQKGLLEKEMATHCSIPAWRIPWTKEPGGSPWSHKELDTTECLNTHTIVV